MKLIIALAVLLACCGYVGDPLPPALRIPVPVDDLAAVQRGDRLIIQFRVSAMTTEGLRIEGYEEVDLRIGAEGVLPFHQPTWESNARSIDLSPPADAGLVRVETPARDWTGREIVIGLRLAGSSGRWSDWSNVVRLEVVEPLDPPADLRAEAVHEGVGLRWEPVDSRDNVRYRIFRRLADAESVVMMNETPGAAWVDTGASFGASYEYRVQAVLPAGGRVAESELSDPVTIIPVDRFPPPPPENLRAVAGLDSIELTWDRVPSEDLAFYRVYRERGRTEEKRIGERVTAPAYSDRAVRSGESYRYRVTAVDRLGNESPFSRPVEQVAP